MKKLLAYLLLFFAWPAFAACPDPLPPLTACVEWQAPTENTDGTPITDLAGFKLYYDTQPITAPIPGNEIDIPDPLATELTEVTTNLNLIAPPGGGNVDVYFRMLAYDDSGNESILSNEIVESVSFPDNQIPGAPTILRVLININVN